MLAFIFVSVICIGTSCDFVTSTQALTQDHCKKMKTQFYALPFKPEVTVAAATCAVFDKGTDV
jgi:Ni,Fe-hydrogenase III small subunit